MMRSFKNTVLAVVALATLAGCGQAPGLATTGSAGTQASWSSPTTVLAVRNDVKRGLMFQRTVLGTDELKAGMSRTALETVAARYRELSASAISHSKSAPDLKAYAAKLQSARKQDAAVTPAAASLAAAATQNLVYTVGEYQAAFKSIADDLDARLGQVKREKLD